MLFKRLFWRYACVLVKRRCIVIRQLLLQDNENRELRENGLDDAFKLHFRDEKLIIVECVFVVAELNSLLKFSLYVYWLFMRWIKCIG